MKGYYKNTINKMDKRFKDSVHRKANSCNQQTYEKMTT